MDFLYEPWPWYIAGPIIGLSVPLLLLVGNKMLGISSSLRHTCAAVAPFNISFLKYNWKSELWNMVFVLGILIGGFLAGSVFVKPDYAVAISDATVQDIAKLGVTEVKGLLPDQIFNLEFLFSVKGLLVLVFGGFMIGFGSRYAGGCTSGHAIMGISSLQWPSLVTVIFFFIGGLLMTHFILPLIF
jgi:uncharacterized membrane protein YedE/YeeE